MAFYPPRVRSSDLLDRTTYIHRSTRLSAVQAASPQRTEQKENSTAPRRNPTAAPAPLLTLQKTNAVPTIPPTIAPETPKMSRRDRNSGSADIERKATSPFDPFARVRISHSTISPRLNCTGPVWLAEPAMRNLPPPLAIASTSLNASGSVARGTNMRWRILCGLTVELSGAAAVAWAWHFIEHASAPTSC